MKIRVLLLAVLASALFLTATPGLVQAAPPSRPSVSVNCSNADLRAVLKDLARKMGLNLYVHPGVQGKVTMQARNMPADLALRLVLGMQSEKYDFKVVEDTLIVATPDKLATIPSNVLRPRR